MDDVAAFLLWILISALWIIVICAAIYWLVWCFCPAVVFCCDCCFLRPPYYGTSAPSSAAPPVAAATPACPARELEAGELKTVELTEVTKPALIPGAPIA